MTASALEIAWSLIALIGLFASSRAAYLAYGDLKIAKAEHESRPVLATGAQQVRQWVASVVKCACLLIIGVQAMLLTTAPGRGNNAMLSGTCLIIVCLLVAWSPISYLRNRARVLE